ncbi:hypothetical protein GLOIN_2v1853170 [Rhizophagus irregularis DAOM 181602=DAOM 197198]|nr:hypothetical protein GLOIN_2v1853170 [Rhizophagus irregularis DAOM 181602=DAOM 197198]
MIQLQILEEFMDRFLFKGEKKHSQNKTWKMFFIGEAMRIRGCVQTQFANCQYIAEGGFSKVYKAKWLDGPHEKIIYK